MVLWVWTGVVTVPFKLVISYNQTQVVQYLLRELECMIMQVGISLHNNV